MSVTSSNNDGHACGSSTSIGLQSQVECLELTDFTSDNFSLFDVLQNLKDQVRTIGERINQLDQYLNIVKNPIDPSTYQEIIEVKRNIINGITHLLKETKPLYYPVFQSLSSVQLLKTYEKVSSECKLLLKTIKQDSKNIVERTDGFKNLSIYIKDFQQEVNSIMSQNTMNTEIENEVAREFKECKSDMYALLSQVDPTSELKEILSLLVECNDDNEDTWVNIEDMPHLVLHCKKLLKNGFVVQNEQNKYLFKLNL